MRCASGAAMEKPSVPQQQQAQQSECIEMNYPLFTFSRGRCMDHARDEMSDSLYKPLIRQLATLAQELEMEGASLPQLSSFDHDPDDSESEEFVLL